MTEIKPKYVDGEPVCDMKGCPSGQFDRFDVCRLAHRVEIDGHTVCSHALRRDREKYKAERDALRCCANCDFLSAYTEDELFCDDKGLLQKPVSFKCSNWQPKEQGE